VAENAVLSASAPVKGRAGEEGRGEVGREALVRVLASGV